MVSRLHSDMQFDMLSKLPSSSFRIRKVTHRPVVEGVRLPNEVVTLNISAPANWYMMGGDVSRVCWTAFYSQSNATYQAPTNDFDPQRNAQNRHSLYWGAGSCFSSVRETLNSGGLEVSALTDRSAVRPVMMARGMSSKRVSELSNSNVKVTVRRGPDQTNTYQNAAVGGNLFTYQGPEFSQNLQIPELMSSGCADRWSRSQGDNSLVFDQAPPSNRHGFSYSCPLSTFSRIGSGAIIPVGFLGAYNPSNGFSLEFRIADVADAIDRGVATALPPNVLEIQDLRIEATYIEVLDEAVQRAVEGLFNKVNSIEVEGRVLTARLEMPVISYNHSSYILPQNTTSRILRIPSNSPSVRGLMLVVRPSAGAQFGSGLSSPIWASVRVQVGGLCIQESPARDRGAQGADTLGSWMATESFRSAHLFSYYPPDQEASRSDTAMARFLISKPQRLQNADADDAPTVAAYDCPNIIHLSFENAPHYSTDGVEQKMAKGLDLRNIGELRLELEYATLDADQSVDVVLAHDEVYAVDRSGATNITQYVF